MITRTYIRWFIATIFIFFSCNKDTHLNPAPSTSISELNAFDTPDRIVNQVKGLYVSVKSGAFYGGRYIVYNEVRGENYINETNNAVTALQTWNFTVNNSAQEVTSLWSAAYLAINRCNLFLDGMAEKGNAVVGDELAKNYNAEAKFLRALCYYSLLQLYARPYYDGNGSKLGVPLRLSGNKAPGNYDLARSTVAEVYQQILKDLNEAEADLPANYSTALNNTTRAHKNTAIALKTRVYLSMQRYNDVVTEANKIVSATAPFVAPSGVPNQLQADIALVFKAPYTTTESIFSFPFAVGADVPGTQNQLAYYFSRSPAVSGANGEFSLNATGIIADAGWTSSDARRNFITIVSGKNYLIKYATGSPFTDYVPVLRYSEVLLNLAEAKVRTTNSVDAQAVALLNAVRHRADATITYTTADFATPAALIDAILKERQIEFLGEGLRSPDIMRLGLTFPAKGTASAITPAQPQYVWPISADELLYNSLAVDN